MHYRKVEYKYLDINFINSDNNNNVFNNNFEYGV